MKVLGISCYYHDAAAALVVDGVVRAAAQEERFTRKKHDPALPAHAIRYCLGEAGETLESIDAIAFYEDPGLKFRRILRTYKDFFPRSLPFMARSLPKWLPRLNWRQRLVTDLNAAFGSALTAAKIQHTEHHLAHAASAFLPSPFEESAVLVMDGVGEFATTSIWHGRGAEISPVLSIDFPHSLGLLYSAFTYYTGFKVNSGEYKVMGLAPYGEPTYVRQIKDHLIELRPDGTYRMNMAYFDYATGDGMTRDRFHSLFGGPPREPESPMGQREMDLARSIQDVTEEAMLGLAARARRETGSPRLCMAGGVALNCVGNGKILRAGVVDDLWIQPAAGDAGGALGAALLAYHRTTRAPRTVQTPDAMQGSYLGPVDSLETIRRELDAAGAKYTVFDSEEALCDAVAGYLAEEKVVGWHQGRMEFGPRALGGRSILGDARSPKMQKVMNLKIKYRESFRPFAPAVLREQTSRYFDLAVDSPYMLLVAAVREELRRPMTAAEQQLFGIDKLNVPRSEVPAITHVDYSARVQSVDARTNPRFHRLLTSFHAKTGCGLLVNTSFNVRGEPIVCTPTDSYRCFMRTEMDVLAIGNVLLLKPDQPPVPKDTSWMQEFALD